MKTVVELAMESGIAVKKVASTNGGEWAGACPGCGGTDRFRIWPEQNHEKGGAYWCRGCEKAGDSIQFLRDFRGMDYRQACTELDRPVGEGSRIPGPVTPRPKPSRKQRPARPASSPDGVDERLWRTKAEKLVGWAHDHLMKNEKQLAWLEARGIHKRAAKDHLLGWNPGENGRPAVFRPRASWGLPPKMRNGKRKRLWIPRGFVIPALSIDGRLMRVRIRRIDEDLSERFDQRYVVVEGSSMGAMVLGADRQAFVVVEAELDAVAVFASAGELAGAVAVGSSSTKPDSTADELLDSSQAVLVALDFDAAGAGAWPWWQRTYRQAVRWPAPAGKDPGEAFAAGVNLYDWVLAGLPPGVRIGRSGLEKQKRREGKPADAAPAAVAAEGPVGELAALLQKYPVQVLNTNERTAILKPMRWVNEKVERRVSELVFFDPQVREHLAAHPADVIDGKNLLTGGGWK